MKNILTGIQKSMSIMLDTRNQYRKLQQHLDKQAVGFPSTFNGIELDLLKDMFTIDEAAAALYLNYRFELFETIYERAKPDGYTEKNLHDLLDAMEKKGAIFVRRDLDDTAHYALHPYVIGMFEMQLKRLTPALYLKTRTYMLQKFAFEYLSSEILQMRVIPVHKSIAAIHNIATYDQIRDLVEQAEGKIGIAECICRKGKDSIGQSCKATDRREVCIGFRDYHDSYVRHHWGRSISKEEAFDILDKNEKEGLVLMPSNMQEPNFVCSCCDCCCGILEILNMLPSPAEKVCNNFESVLNPDECKGCGLCLEKCPTQAIANNGKHAISIDSKRCIGCGLCAVSCKSGAIRMKQKTEKFVPPKNHESLYDFLMEHKKSAIGKIYHLSRTFLDF
jgi:ferredoxin